MKNTTSRLGSENIGKLLFSLAAPAIAAQIVAMLYNVVDRMYIGHIENIGSYALTGVGVCLPLIVLVNAFASLVCVGGSSRSSIMLGAGREDDANKTIGNCFMLLLIVSAVITFIYIVFNRPVLMLFGASENTISYATEYMTIYAIGTVFVQITTGMNLFITAQGFSRTSMATIVLGAVLNIILDPIFIFTFDLGVRGAAIATVISQFASALFVILFLAGKRTVLKVKVRNFRFEKRIILPCIALGLSPFVMQSTESVLAVCFNSSLYRYGGDVAVGAMTIIASVAQLETLPLTGLTQGASPIISYNYGARNYPRVKRSYALLMITGLTYTVLFNIVVELFPDLFIGMFTSDPVLVEYTRWTLRLYCILAFTKSLQNCTQQAFLSLGNARTSLWMACFRKLILLIPLIYILPLFFSENKVFAVLLAEPVCDIIAAVVTNVLFLRFFRKVLRGETHIA